MRIALTPVIVVIFLLSIMQKSSAEDKTSSAALCFKAESSNPSLVISSCSILIKKKTNNADVVRALNRRGLAYERSGKLADALHDFDMLLKLNSKGAGYFDNRQRVNLSLGRLNEALADANTAANLAPRASFVYRGRGLVYEAMGRYKDAFKEFNFAVQLEPNDTGLWYDRGRIQALLGNYQESISDFTFVYSRDSTAALAIRERSRAYFLSGRFQEAANDINNFLTLQPGDQNGIALRSAIQSRIGDNMPVAAANKAVLTQKRERRVALVIGNSAYGSVPKLANPGRDASAITDALKRSGFQFVQLYNDIGRNDFRDALHSFSREAETADWAVVYFAGHGLEMNGANYLIPADAKMETDRDVPFESIALDDVLLSAEPAKLLRLVILDACRDNPFVSRMRRTNASRSLGRGLAQIEPEAGTLVVYAAKHGHTAFDGQLEHSPFAQAFLNNIMHPDIEVRRLFDLIRDDVMMVTSNLQQPYTYGSLSGRRDYFFVQKADLQAN